MTIYLLGNDKIDKLAVARLLSEKTGWKITDTDTELDDSIICTSNEEQTDTTKHKKLTVFLYESSATTEEQLLSQDHKHDIQIDAGSMDPSSISEIIVNLLV